MKNEFHRKYRINHTDFEHYGMLHDTYELSISSQAGDRRQATT